MPRGRGKSRKTGPELCGELREQAHISNSSSSKVADKALEAVCKLLGEIRVLLFSPTDEGDGADHVSEADQIAVMFTDQPGGNNEKAKELELLKNLFNLMGYLPFDAMEDFAFIFCSLVNRMQSGQYLCVTYIINNQWLLGELVEGQGDGELALHCGMMLRSCIRHEILTKVLLWREEYIDQLLSYLCCPRFDIASDAMFTVREMLTRHKTLSAQFLEGHYDSFIPSFINIVNGARSSHFARKGTLRLLCEMLLDRSKFDFMLRFIADGSQLRVVLQALLDPSGSIRYEALSVLKIFAANPKKTDEISLLLKSNKQTLVDYARTVTFQREGISTEQLAAERQMALATLEAL